MSRRNARSLPRSCVAPRAIPAPTPPIGGTFPPLFRQMVPAGPAAGAAATRIAPGSPPRKRQGPCHRWLRWHGPCTGRAECYAQADAVAQLTSSAHEVVESKALEPPLLAM